jgi:3-methylfumaryl-CoA hydratase
MNKLKEDLYIPLHSNIESIRTEICSVASVRRVAAMLDLSPVGLEEKEPLPRGWQFILMAADTKKSQLRADGFPGLGVAMPDLGLPRLMLGARAVAYIKDIPIGSQVMRKSSIQSLTHKTTKTGPMAIANIRHELQLIEEKSLALIETQTYLLFPASRGGVSTASGAFTADVSGYRVKTIVPDETMLFQYSALGFNSHKIHIDRAHARNVEGFPDIVVNGGLVSLLLTDFLRLEIGVTPSSINVRHLTPLFCGRPITMVANKINDKWQLQAYDNRSILAVDIEVETDEF